jgi:zinc protease
MLVTPPAVVHAAPARAPSPAPVIQTTLPNGMHVVLLPDHLAPVATTVMEYDVGSNDDTIPGIAHATEHMMFRGTYDVSAAQFADIAARAGAQYDAQTSNLNTLYYFTLPSAYVDIALRLEADRMTKASMSPAAWATERGAIEQEVRAHESSPVAGILQRMRKAFYGDTPYANDPVGTIAGFDKMTASDIAAFYHAWYHPNDATLVVAGDIDPSKTLQSIQRLFGAIPAAPLPKVAPIVLPTPSTATIDGGVAELPVPVVDFAYRFPALGDSQFAAAEVLMQALDDQRSALHDLVVDGKALFALGLSASFPQEGSGEVLAVGLPSSSPDSLEAALQHAIDLYRTSGVPHDLIVAAKTRLLSQQAYREASIPGLAFAWSAAREEGVDSPDQLYAAIANVTDKDVNAVLNRFMAASARTMIVMRPEPAMTLPRYSPSKIQEDVSYPVDEQQPLPEWAVSYFRARLVPPGGDATTVMRLQNGLRLVVRHETFSPVVVLDGEVRSNTDLNEPRGKDGVAGLTDQLLDWGTTTYDRTEYQSQLDAIAATVSLGRDFSLKVQARDFDRGVALLADGMLHPAFPSSAFKLLRGNESQTLSASAKEPSTIADLAKLHALYPPGDPHRRHATAASVSRIALGDVRRWYNLAFRPDLTTIAVVGDVTPERARAEVERYFGTWKAKGKMPKFDYPRVRWPHHKTVNVTVTSPANRQSDVTLTQDLALHRSDAQAAALELANTILSGESTASLLFSHVRTDKGFVYSIDSDLSIGQSTSTFTITFASDTKNVARAQAAALGVIERLRTRPLPPEELQRAKALLLAQRVLPLDSYEGVASDLLSDAADNWTSADEHTYWARILSVTPEQLRNAMHRWIDPQHFNRVVVAPGRT